jgi:hypothetical protein
MTTLDVQAELQLQLSRLQDDDSQAVSEALGLTCMLLGRGLVKSKYPADFKKSLQNVVSLTAHDSQIVRVSPITIDSKFQNL